MKIALLGGAGYLGSVINSELCARVSKVFIKDEVTVFDNLLYSEEYKPDNLVLCDVINNPPDLSEFDRIVWMLDIDMPDFYTYPVSQKYMTKNMDTFKEMCGKYGKRIIFITDLCEGIKVGTYVNFVRAKVALLEIAGGQSIALPQLYGPSPRMRFDTDLNIMCLMAYMVGGITLDNWLTPIRTLGVATAGKYIADNIHSNDSEGIYGIYSLRMSAIDCAGIIVKIFDSKAGMTLTDNYAEKWQEPETSVPNIIRLDVPNGQSIKSCFEYMRSALSQGIIDDPAKDRYSNAKIITSYQSLAQFVGYIKTNFT